MSLPLIRRGDSTILRAVFDICRSLHLPNQPSQDCQAVLYERSTFNVQHRQLRNLRTPIPRQFGGAAIGSGTRDCMAGTSMLYRGSVANCVHG